MNNNSTLKIGVFFGTLINIHVAAVQKIWTF